MSTLPDPVGWLAAIVDSSDDAVFSMNVDGIITSWNAAATRMFGYEAAEVIDHSILMLIPGDRQGEEIYILSMVKRGERIHHYETVRRCKDGRLLNVSLTVSPIFDGDRRIVGVSKIARDITDWKITRETQQLLLRELNHRSKNLLAVADAIVRQTATAGSKKSMIESVSRRLMALSINQDLLIESDWRGVGIRQIVETQLAPIVGNIQSRVSLEGQDIIVGAAVAQSIALAIYELGANALKYGALASTGGKVGIKWAIQAPGEDAMPEFRMSWRETGGRRIHRPRKKGFGRTIIEDVVARALHGTTTAQYLSGGLSWELVTNRLDILMHHGAPGAALPT